MTVEALPLYPVPLKENGLVEDFKTGCHSHDIPKKTVDLEIAALLKKLESRSTFNPNLKFDASKHIIFKEEYYKSTKTATLKELGINKTRTAPISDFAAAYPFPLISQEAVDMVLWEALQPEVIEKWSRLPNSSLATKATRLDFHIGGHCRFIAPFSYALYNSPIVAEIVSNFAGVKCGAMYNSEFGHLNVSLASLDEDEVKNVPKSQNDMLAELEAQNQKKGHEIPSTLGLHYDSGSLALVIMLDLGDGAVGGETGVITGDEKVFRVPDPKIGYATLIQGMVLRHVATKPVSNSNRITGVTGYAPIGPDILDNCRITSVKPSVLPRASYNQYYSEWFEYRFKHLEDHLRYQREKIMEKFEAGEQFDQLAIIEICKNMEKYLNTSWKEMECVYNPPYPPKEFHTPYDELPDEE